MNYFFRESGPVANWNESSDEVYIAGMARVFREVEPRREKGIQRTFRINVLIQDGIEEARGSEPSFELSQLNQTMLSRCALESRGKYMLWYLLSEHA